MRCCGRSATVPAMTIPAGPADRYARITQRLIEGLDSSGAGSAELAGVLESRVMEAIAAECALRVTSDYPPARLADAVLALADFGIELRVEDGLVVVEHCFCRQEHCDHPWRLLDQLLDSPGDKGTE